MMLIIIDKDRFEIRKGARLIASGTVPPRDTPAWERFVAWVEALKRAAVL